MIELSILIFSVSFLVLSFSYSHRLLSETRIKKSAYYNSVKEWEMAARQQPKPNETDELIKRLDDFRNQRFGRQLYKNKEEK
jgi:hypothetical protein